MNMPCIAAQNDSFPLYGGRSFVRKTGDLLAPNLKSLADIEENKRRMGPTAFAAQCLLDPTPPDGQRLQWNWFHVYDEPLPRDDYSYVVQSWDTATSDDPKAAFSVCMTFGYDQRRWDLLDVFCERLTYPRLRRAAKQLYDRWRPERVIIENASSGRALAQDMREDLPQASRRAIIPFTPLSSKEDRFDLQLSRIERHLVNLTDTAPWLDAFKHEVRRFPFSTYKDQVDALTQFLEWTGSRAGSIELRDPITGRRAKTPRPHGMRPPGSW